MIDGADLMSPVNLPLAGSVVCSTVIGGMLVGAGLFRRRTHRGRPFTFGLRTMLLLPVVLAPLLIALLPVRPYQGSISTTTPFSFVVLDAATGQPISNASVQLIDPRFAMDDSEIQAKPVATRADGSADYFLFANVHGREGLLGRTETITYNPLLIRVEATGYRSCFTALGPDFPLPAERMTAPPVGLTYPPPPSLTIRLKSADAEEKPPDRALAQEVPAD
jgi:hypothetical protein